MITISQEGDLAIFRIDGFLGQTRFALYKAAVAGCRYNPARRVNTVGVERVLPMLKRLHEAGFGTQDVELAPELRASLEALVLIRRLELQGADERADEIDRRMRLTGISLYPFQRAGVAFLASRRGALLADSPRCGKTCQTLAAIPDGSPALVVGPAVAKGVWRREAERWRPDLTPVVLSGRSSFRWPAPGELIVLNFDILPPPLEVKRPDGVVERNVFNTDSFGNAPDKCVLVYDEAHYLKSSRSQRATRARVLADEVRDANGRVWLLTGTPLLNEPPELWNVLKVADLEREAFESWKTFFELFGGFKDKFGGTHWSSTPDTSVPDRLKRVMLRRTREEVLKDLPPKIVQVLEVEIGDSANNELDKIAHGLRDHCNLTDPYAVLEASRRERVVFDSISRLRSLLAAAKIPAMLEIVEEHENAGSPLLVMSAHLEPLKALAKRPGWAVIDGSVTASFRTDIEESFQRGELKGVACSIKAAGVAITLSRATEVLFVDESWTPSENEQAEDRAVAIGKTQGVVVTRMFADHELDKHVLRVLGRKEKLIARTLGEEKTT